MKKYLTLIILVLILSECILISLKQNEELKVLNNKMKEIDMDFLQSLDDLRFSLQDYDKIDEGTIIRRALSYTGALKALSNKTSFIDENINLDTCMKKMNDMFSIVNISLSGDEYNNLISFLNSIYSDTRNTEVTSSFEQFIDIILSRYRN